jgi:hypothetical protein
MELTLSVRDQLSMALAGVTAKMGELERKMQTVNATAGKTSSVTGQAASSFGTMATGAGKLGGAVANVERGLMSLAGATGGPLASVAATIGSVSGAVRGLGIAVSGVLGPWGLLVAGAAVAATALYSFTSGSNAAAEAQKKLAENTREAVKAFDELLVARGKALAGIEFAGVKAGAEGKSPAEQALAGHKALAATKGGDFEKLLADFRAKQGVGGYDSKAAADAAWAQVQAAQQEYEAATATAAAEEQALKLAVARGEQYKKNDEAWGEFEKKANERDIEMRRKRAEWEDENAKAADEYGRGVTYDENETRQKRAKWEDENAAAADEYVRGVMYDEGEPAREAQKKLEDAQERQADKIRAHWEGVAGAIDNAFQDSFQSIILDGESFADSFGRLGKNIGSVFLSEIMGSFTKGIAATFTEALQSLTGAVSGGGGTKPAAGTAAGSTAGQGATSAAGSLFGSLGESGSAGGISYSNGLAAMGGGIMGGVSIYQQSKSAKGLSVGSGAMQGAAAGAMIGSVAGPIGTVIGAVVGAIAGAIAGTFSNKKAKAKKKAKKKAAYYAELARKAGVADLAKRTLQKGSAGGLMERADADKIGNIMAGGLTYDEAIGYFGSDDAIQNAAAKVKASQTTTNTTNNVSVQAPVTVHATVNSEADVDAITRSIGQKLGQTISAAIPRP